MMIPRNRAFPLLIACLAVQFAACTQDDPEVRVRNDSSKKVTVRITYSTLTEHDFTDVPPGGLSDIHICLDGSPYFAVLKLGTEDPDPYVQFYPHHNTSSLVIVSEDAANRIRVVTTGK